jgi:hypothetical protein
MVRVRWGLSKAGVVGLGGVAPALGGANTSREAIFSPEGAGCSKTAKVSIVMSIASEGGG